MDGTGSSALLHRYASFTRRSSQIARRVAAVMVALFVLTTAGPAVAQTPINPVRVTTDMHGAQAPVIDLGFEFDYVLEPLPDSIMVRVGPYSSRTKLAVALIGNIETTPSEFLGEFADAESTRRGSGRVWAIVTAGLIVLAALVSAFFICFSVTKRSVKLLIAGAVYGISAGLILYNMTRQFEVHHYRYYDDAHLGDVFAVVEVGSALVLFLIGLGMVVARLHVYYAGPRWVTLLGLVSVAGAGYVLATGYLRVERPVIVDNATDAPYRVTVDGVDLGTLPARRHATFFMSRGSLLHQPSGSLSVGLRAEQGSAEQTMLIALAGPLNQLIVNVENRNAYRVEKGDYR